jgi:hypothetical protein
VPLVAGDVSGLALASAAVALVATALARWFHLLNTVGLAGRRAPLFAAIGAGIALGIAALTREPGWIGGGLAAVAIAVGLVWIALGLVAPQSRQQPTIRVGGPLPDFEAPDHEGRIFRLSSLRGQPILLKFFRGHW